MATAIVGPIVSKIPDNTKTAKSFWRCLASVAFEAANVVGEINRAAAKPAVQWTKNTAMPAISKGADVTFGAVDGVCMKANKLTVDFLVKYPGIAMTLSPQTIVRMAVAEHYKEMAGQPAADGHHIGDAVDNVEHAVVNIMQ